MLVLSNDAQVNPTMNARVLFNNKGNVVYALQVHYVNKGVQVVVLTILLVVREAPRLNENTAQVCTIALMLPNQFA